jgi:flavin reductase (DIM6/NTAB) family NADH-FMN oxidoreductase RutF
MKNLPLPKVAELLGPGPVVLLSTAPQGKPADVMAMAWHMMVDFNPPLIACICGENNFTFETLKKTRECVIAIPSSRLTAKVMKVGSTSGKTVDKFKKFGLTALPASRVMAPLVRECFANIECKVVDAHLASKHNMFILEAVKAWIDPAQKNPKTIHHQGNGKFMVGEKTLVVSKK